MISFDPPTNTQARMRVDDADAPRVDSRFQSCSRNGKLQRITNWKLLPSAEALAVKLLSLEGDTQYAAQSNVQETRYQPSGTEAESTKPGGERLARPSEKSRKPRGPAPKMEDHRRVADVVRGFSDLWRTQENLEKIGPELDRKGVPVPPTWPKRRPAIRSWRRAAERFPRLMISAIEYRLKMAAR